MEVFSADKNADYWYRKSIKRWWVFANTVDPLTEGVEQRRKRQFLKNVINKVKVVGCKNQWTQERADKTTDRTIIKI